MTERESGRDAAEDARRAIGRVPPRPDVDDAEKPQTEDPVQVGDRGRPHQGMGGPLVDAAEEAGADPGSPPERPPG